MRRDAMRCETRRDDGYKDQRSCAFIARSFASFASFATTRTRASRGEPPTERAIPRSIRRLATTRAHLFTVVRRVVRHVKFNLSFSGVPVVVSTAGAAAKLIVVDGASIDATVFAASNFP